MVTELISLFTSTGAGGLIGMVGSWLTKREERKNLQLKYQHEVAMANIRKEEMQAEAAHELAMADKAMERAQVEGDIAIGEAELTAFNTSLKQQGVSTGVKFVDALRGAMRPLITIYLLIIASYITYKINTLVGGFDSLEQGDLLNTYKDIIQQVLFLTATAVTWWFGSRPSTQRK
ncbi:hypothetical protein [Agarilytica rhodophyticola]|uniref:hypothetical protein n=1 Tax=Agarilytica rhodophyticola TaxID=1737490 RepID=UPI001C1F5FE1|nr:hypothetical protein [Agarilytica rhodophyticola]